MNLCRKVKTIDLKYGVSNRIRVTCIMELACYQHWTDIQSVKLVGLFHPLHLLEEEEAGLQTEAGQQGVLPKPGEVEPKILVFLLLKQMTW